MNLELLTLCDAATDVGGKLNILGAADTIIAPAIPFKLDRCSIAMRLRVSRVEEGEHKVKLAIIDGDGGSLMNLNGTINIQFREGMGSAAANLIINVNGMEIKTAGEYALDVAVNGMQMGTRPIFVAVAPKGGGAQPGGAMRPGGAAPGVN